MAKIQFVEADVCRFFLIITLSLIQTQTVTSSGKHYSIIRGIDVYSPCLSVISDVSSRIHCASLCQGVSPNCKSGSYHLTRRTCCLTEAHHFYYDLTFYEDQESYFFHDPSPNWDIVHQGWTLVFRATAGTGTSFFRVWKNISRHDDRPLGNTDLQLGCMTLIGQNLCRSHFRSQYLDLWGNLNVQKVALRMYQNGTEKVNLIFNGTGSDVISWMAPSRLLQSPWNDATSNASYNIFKVEGAGQARRFHINKRYGACYGDSGWMCAVDTYLHSGSCNWERQAGYVPSFVYSSTTTSIFYEQSSDFAQADVMAVFILY